MSRRDWHLKASKARTETTMASERPGLPVVPSRDSATKSQAGAWAIPQMFEDADAQLINSFPSRINSIPQIARTDNRLQHQIFSL